MASTDTVPPPFPGDARFEAREILGRGASGVVYRALDRESGGEVALKTLSSPDAEQIYHLKSEFRSLAQIVHPNLVQLDELVVTPSACFFTMELLRGQTFSEWVRTLSGEARGWDEAAALRLQRVALELALGISALHEAGKLHRDIKPSNVLVTNDERAVLVDFGLCTALRLVERTRNPFVGTLLYMAPEQAWGKPLSRAADWYALGAILYEAVVGDLPFAAEGSRLLFEKEKPVAIPAAYRDSAALPLLQLAIALMAPRPEERPRSGEVLDALGNREAIPRPRHSSAPFVGRSAEHAVLDAALHDTTRAGAATPVVAHIEGASGVGKTELVERYLAGIERQPNVLVLRGRCHPRETVTYNGFDGVVDDLSEWLSTLDESEMAELLPADVGALHAIFPVLGRTPSIRSEPDAPRVDPYDLRRRAFAALRELCTKIAQRKTLVVVLDDLHSGGADTAALVGDVFRTPDAPKLLLILAYRREEVGPALPLLRERAPALFDSRHRIQLRPLERDASRELVLQLLGREDGSAQSLAERVAVASGGHPLFLRELTYAAHDADGADLLRLLGERIASLPETERAILELATIAGRPLPRRVILSAAGAGERARPEVSRLVRKRLLRELTTSGEPGIEPYHAKVRDAMLDRWPAPERTARHRALADALLSEQEPNADALVEQLRGAGDRAGAGRYALIAADRARAALAFDHAVHLYRIALELHAEHDAWRVRAKLAEALVDTGRGLEAAETFARAAREAQGEPETADLERRAAEHYLRSGYIEEGTALLRRVLASAGLTYPSSGAAAIASTMADRTMLALRERFGARATPPTDLARVDACWSAGLGCAWIDTMRAAAFQAKHMRLALDAGEPSRIALAQACEASQLAAIGGEGRTTRARSLVRRALVDAEGDRAARPFTLLMAGTIEFYSSRWRAALESCTHAETLLREQRTRSEWDLMTSHTLALASMAYLGEIEGLAGRQRRLLDEARDRGNMLAAICLACGPATLGWLAADDPDAAERHAERAIAPWKENHQLPTYLHLLALTQTALYRGEARRALSLVTRAWPRLVTSMTLYVQNFRITLRHLRGRAALAVLSNVNTSAFERLRLTRLVRAEADRLAAEDNVWAPALAGLLRGGLAGSEGRTDVATRELGGAADRLRALDMMVQAEAADVARRRLGGSGFDPSALRARGVTAPERLVAMLVPGVRA